MDISETNFRANITERMKLHFVEYGSPKTLVILHGLLGSERNWYSVAKKLSDHYRLIIPDLRNHGVSPHDPEHSIVAMRKDIEALVDRLHLHEFYLLGHSMGGHVAMNYAFAHPERVKALIVEDIAPRSYGTGLIEILTAMNAVDLNLYKEKKQVEVALAEGIKNPAVRSFVITNLVRDHDRMYWRVNLPALTEFAANEIVRFKASENDRFHGPTLFVGGEKSMYNLRDDAELIAKHFPSSALEMIPDAGHWIHHEKADVFCQIVMDFLNRH